MDTRSLLNHTVHRSNLLLSATKANRRHINLNSDHINKLKCYLDTLQLTVKTNFHVISDTLSHLSLKIKIEHALVSLEQNVNRIINYFNRRRHQKHSLYHHTLAEDLLGPGQLQEILAQARALRFATMPQNWHYEFCKVIPVWTTPQDITFKVSLPLHDGKNYILYSIQLYPFPIRPGFHAQLQVRSSVAYSSTSGLLFEPILCQGSGTKVCLGGPLVDAEKFVCERALVSKDVVATRKCQVKVSQSNDTITKEVTPGLYIVSTPSILPKLHCDARSERIIKLLAGVYMISLNHTCILKGGDWTLPGLNRFFTPLHIKTTGSHQLTNCFSPLLLKPSSEVCSSTPVDPNTPLTFPHNGETSNPLDSVIPPHPGDPNLAKFIFTHSFITGDCRDCDFRTILQKVPTDHILP